MRGDLSFALLLYTTLAFIRTAEGQTYPTGVYNAAYGWNPTLVDYKWTAGVYKKHNDSYFRHICGGSLISQEIVLSAAHCFPNDGNDVIVDNYRITLGELFREYDEASEENKIEISDVIFHSRYHGRELRYAHDIVIVRLKEKVPVSKFVEPVAVDWRTTFKDEQLKNLSGTVVGWGYTEYNEPSIVRNAVTLPFVDFDACWKAVPRDFRDFLTPDKFCAGLRNGTAVCRGDSGGGLVFLDPTDNVNYIRGIVSVGVISLNDDDNTCRLAQYSAFISVASYRDWLQEKLHEMGIDIQTVTTSTPHD